MTMVRLLPPQPASLVSRISPYNVIKKPAVGGLLALAGESLDPEIDIFLATVPKISAHHWHGGRFLEKRAGDLVRLHWVGGLAVKTV